MTWTKRSKPASWPTCLVRLLILAAFELSCRGLHPVWLASGGGHQCCLSQLPLHHRSFLQGTVKAPLDFGSPLGQGCAVIQKNRRNTAYLGHLLQAICVGLPLGSCPTTAKKKGIFNVFILEWILRVCFCFVLAVVGGLFFSNQVLCRSWACLLNGS